MDDERRYKVELALQEMRSAISFFDRVRASTEDEQIAVGRDHYDWIEKAARRCAELADPNATI